MIGPQPKRLVFCPLAQQLLGYRNTSWTGRLGEKCYHMKGLFNAPHSILAHENPYHSKHLSLCVIYILEGCWRKNGHWEPGLTIILHPYWGYYIKLLKQSTTLKQEPCIGRNCSWQPKILYLGISFPRWGLWGKPAGRMRMLKVCWQ